MTHCRAPGRGGTLAHTHAWWPLCPKVFLFSARPSLIHPDITKFRHSEAARTAHASPHSCAIRNSLIARGDAIVRVESTLMATPKCRGSVQRLLWGSTIQAKVCSPIPKGTGRNGGRLYRGHPRKSWPYIELSKSHHRR